MPCPQPIPLIRAENARVARAAFPRRHPYHRAADDCGAVLTDETFAAHFRRRARPATVLRFAEGSSDCQAADAGHVRLDREDVPPLEVDDLGFDTSALCASRPRP